MAIYGAGYERTKPAADRMASEAMDGRRSMAPVATRSPVQPAPKLSPDSSAPAIATSTAAHSEASGALPDVAQKASVAANDPERSPAQPSSNAAAPPPATAVSDTKASAPKSSAATVPAAIAPVAASAASAKSSKAEPAVASPPAKKVDDAETATAPDAASSATVSYRDGMYLGRGTSRHGDIEALVEIKDGRIVSAIISQCLTRYSCSWISALPPQVVARQSPDVDYVSGATQSANAFYYAVVQALSQAK